MTSLYQLTKENQEILDSILENSGEVSEESEKQIEKMNELIITKAVTICEYRQSLEDVEKAITDRLTQLKIAKTAIENKIDRLDNYVLGCMQTGNINSIESEIWSIKIRKPREVVNVLDVEELPIECVKRVVKKDPDKIELLKRLKTGEQIPGCELAMGKTGLIYKQGR